MLVVYSATDQFNKMPVEMLETAIVVFRNAAMYQSLRPQLTFWAAVHVWVQNA